MTHFDDPSDLSALPVVQTAVDVAPFAMLVADVSGRVLQVNSMWSGLSGLAATDSLAYGWLSALDPDSAEEVYRLVHEIAAGAPATSTELLMSTPRGDRWARWWLHLRSVDGVSLVFLAAADIHDEHRSRIDLEHLATHDALTGLLNRRFFVESVEQALRRTQRSDELVGLLYVDLDDFKMVNDRGGHATGDRVLTAVGGRMRLAVRGSDLVGRVGGDEFAVLVDRVANEADASHVAERVAEAVNGYVEVHGERWPVRASIGLAIGSGQTDTVGSLFERADRAMYEAKRGGPPPDAPEPAAAGETSTPASAKRVASVRESLESVRRTLEGLVGADVALKPTD